MASKRKPRYYVRCLAHNDALELVSTATVNVPEDGPDWFSLAKMAMKGCMANATLPYTTETELTFTIKLIRA